MSLNGKQMVNGKGRWCVAAIAFLNMILIVTSSARGQSMGTLVLGENIGGMSEVAYFIAAPDSEINYTLEPGSFLDCGTGKEKNQTDEDGRGQIRLSCGVTLTETLIIPAASQPARLIIHY
ncbi:MAG: hypothetical protein ACWA5L_04700 [bacterium]